MVKKTAGLLLCAVLLAVVLVGCWGKPIEKEAQQSEKRLITVGFSQIGAESDWRIANTESMEEALSEDHGFELLISDAQQKQENQTKAIRDFISQSVDVIVLAPVTETGWETVLGEAREAGIPVIIMDRRIDVTDDSLFSCWIGSDFEQEGVDAANWLVEEMDRIGRKEEEHHIAVLKGTPGSTAEIGRTKGFQNTIEKYENYIIEAEYCGDFTQAGGKAAMESCLQQFEKIDVVVAQNDNMAFGAIEALKNEGGNPGQDVTILSFDAVKAAFEAMIRGELNVSVECNPLHGPRVAELIHKILDGERVAKLQYVEEGIFPAVTAKEDSQGRKY